MLTKLTVKFNINEIVKIKNVQNLNFSLKIEIKVRLSKNILLNKRNLLSMR